MLEFKNYFWFNKWTFLANYFKSWKALSLQTENES